MYTALCACTAGGEGSAALAQLASTLMQLLMSHSRFLPLLLSNPGACPPALPKLVLAMQTPMASLLPVLDAEVQQDQVGGIASGLGLLS